MLEQGHVEVAAQTYAEDLGLDDKITRAHQHRNSVWVFYGYHECLVRLGRGPEAHIIKQVLDLALDVTDVRIKPSCFCHLGALGSKDTDKSCRKWIEMYWATDGIRSSPY